MTIEIIDAFGTSVGEATVTWMAVSDPGSLAEEIAAIFPPMTTVALPTKDARLAWQLKVRP